MAVIRGECRAHTLKRLLRVSACEERLVVTCLAPGPHYTLAIVRPGRYALPGGMPPIRVSSTRMVAPLQVRSLLAGDRLQGQRVVRLLADKAVPRELRPFWPVALQQNTLIAVAGIATAKPAAVQLDFEP